MILIYCVVIFSCLKGLLVVLRTMEGLNWRIDFVGIQLLFVGCGIFQRELPSYFSGHTNFIVGVVIS
jgi:hypothetical protein